MLKTYTGRYENGNFILPETEKATIPDNVNIIITVLDETALVAQNAPDEAWREAARIFLQSVQKIRENGFSPEDNASIDDLQSGMYAPVFEERL